MAVARRFPSAPLQFSPGIALSPSRLCLSDLRHGVPYKFRALTILAASPRRAASYPLPVRPPRGFPAGHQTSALPSASSRFPVAQNTLAVQLTLPLVGRVEDFHIQVSAPCRAHQKQTPPVQRAGSGGVRRVRGSAGVTPCRVAARLPRQACRGRAGRANRVRGHCPARHRRHTRCGRCSRNRGRNQNRNSHRPGQSRRDH